MKPLALLFGLHRPKALVYRVSLGLQGRTVLHIGVLQRPCGGEQAEHVPHARQGQGVLRTDSESRGTLAVKLALRRANACQAANVLELPTFYYLHGMHEDEPRS